MSFQRYYFGPVGVLALCLLCGWSTLDQSTKERVQPQASQTTPSASRVLRLKVGLKVEGQARLKGLARKRFFLIKGSREEHQALLDQLTRQTTLARDCYYRSIGASESLIKWLRDNDCESVYCREIVAQDAEGEAAVPEFALAFARGRKAYGNTELALKWLTVNLPEELRIGFYRRQQSTLRAFLKDAEARAGSAVMSVMTDRNGTAYFTDVEPGAYLLSNLLPVEVGGTSLLWTCEVKVQPGEQGTEMLYTLSDREGKQVKCVGVERPLPVCDKIGKRNDERPNDER